MKICETYKQLKYNLTKSNGRKITHIVIHNTGTLASAQNNCKYFGGGNRNSSADYFINQDGTVYLFNGDIANYYSWHCGDGKGKYGITNAHSIGIEVVSDCSAFTFEQNVSLRYLVQLLMSQCKIPASNVVRHYDASRKLCPAHYCGNATKDKTWLALKNYLLSVQAQAEKSSDPSTSTSYLVKINTETLNVRKGPGTSFAIACTVKMNDVFTIVEERDGWGKLKSGVGWIYLRYTLKK